MFSHILRNFRIQPILFPLYVLKIRGFSVPTKFLWIRQKYDKIEPVKWEWNKRNQFRKWNKSNNQYSGCSGSLNNFDSINGNHTAQIVSADFISNKNNPQKKTLHFQQNKQKKLSGWLFLADETRNSHEAINYNQIDCDPASKTNLESLLNEFSWNNIKSNGSIKTA